MTFAEHYGPWAIIAGATAGVGRALTDRIASEGVNCLLIANDSADLERVAAEVRELYGVEIEILSLDLSSANSSDRIVEATGSREIGLYVSNAGADPHGARFFDRDLDTWLGLVSMNAITPMRVCHHFGKQMKDRRRGGIVLIGSGACYGGSSYTAAYAAAKAFGLCLADGLWVELKPFGVNVLYAALGPTDTPSLHALLKRQGLPPLSNLAVPTDVAEQVLAQLPNGPVFNWGLGDEETGHAPISAAARRKRVLHIEESSKRVFGTT